MLVAHRYQDWAIVIKKPFVLAGSFAAEHGEHILAVDDPVLRDRDSRDGQACCEDIEVDAQLVAGDPRGQMTRPAHFGAADACGRAETGQASAAFLERLVGW